MRITTIVAMLLATTSAVTLAQTVTANGNIGRVNNGTIKKQSEKLSNASGTPR